MRNNESPKSQQSSFFEPGQTLGGRYQIISALGRGGMGSVYHVTQMFLNKELALKTIEKQGLSDDAVRRFQKEARTAFAVKHPNVIAVDDFGLLDDGTPFLVMELIRGETLSEKLKRKTFMPVNEAIPMFLQICQGLACAHELGVVHRDIKPSNIMIPEDATPGTAGSVKIVDFGIATFAPEDADRSITHTSELFGSPLYISPEQCMGGRVDRRADIYSLGCVLFETLTGTPPFIGENALTTIMKHKSGPVPTLKEASLGKSFSKEMEQIVAKMLAKSPEQRYQNANEVAKDLAATMRGEKLQSPVMASKIQQPNAIPRPLTLTRSFFFAAILLTTLMSATAAGFAAFEIKRLESDKPIFYVIPDKANVRARTEESALPLDDATIDRVQRMPDERLRDRLKEPDSDGHVALHFKTITPEQMRMIGNAKWIKFADFESSSVPNTHLDELKNLPKLFYLCFRGTNFDDEGAAKVAGCGLVYMISAGGCNLTDKGVAALATNKKIEYLDLASNNISNASLRSLATLPSLHQLMLTDCKLITNVGLRYLMNSQIQKIALTDNHNFDDEGCGTLAKFKWLRSAILTNTNVTLDGLKVLCATRAPLEEIWIDHCKNISERDVILLSHRRPDLKIHSKNEKPEIEYDQ